MRLVPIPSRVVASSAALLLVVAAAGCGSTASSSSVQSSPAPPQHVRDPAPSNVVSSAGDSVGAIPGSANAVFIYRFKQTEPASSNTFSFRDRDLSFSFRPSPNALYFGVENLQGRPVDIDWDRSVFVDPNGRTGKVGHQSTRWRDRYVAQPQTRVLPQQRYTDYVFALDDLMDPGADPDLQLRRPLLPEDTSAPTYAGRTFGVDLVFIVESQPRTYTFRYEVQSVIPR